MKITQIPSSHIMDPSRTMRGSLQRRWMRGDDRTSPTSTCVTWRRPNSKTGSEMEGGGRRQEGGVVWAREEVKMMGSREAVCVRERRMRSKWTEWWR